MAEQAISHQEIANREHISPTKTGDNIAAKRTANYIWDGSNWQRDMGLDASLAVQIDDATSTVSYIGKALPGTATSAAAWQIKKIDSSSGTAITWAAGSSNFNQIWDNRSLLSYS